MVHETLATGRKEKTGHNNPQIKALYSIIVLLLIVLGLSSWLIYRWQHRQVESLISSLSEAEKKANASQTALFDEIKANSDMQVKYQNALDKLGAAPSTPSAHQPTQEDLDLTIHKAVTVNWDNAGTTFGGVAINLTLKNSTDSTIRIIPSETYKLKDADNHIYTLFFSLGSGLGKSFVPLQVNDLPPGQSVTGYIGIQVPDTNITNYTLIIGDQAYEVSATKLMSFPVVE